MAGENEIILRVENIILSDGTQGQGAGVPTAGDAGGFTLPSKRMGARSFVVGGISAQLLISGASRMLAATGNQELANGIRETAEWGFLTVRALSGDPTAIATAAFKLSAKAIQAITDYISEQKETAANYNELDMLKMRYGINTINSNTEISYGKYGRLKMTDRK